MNARVYVGSRYPGTTRELAVVTVVDGESGEVLEQFTVPALEMCRETVAAARERHLPPWERDMWSGAQGGHW